MLRNTIRQSVRFAWLLGRLPAKLAHELTHIAAMLPWVEQWRIGIEHSATEVEVALDESIPRWAVVIGHLAPFIVGVVLGSVMLLWVALRGLPLPRTVSGWGQLAIALCLWTAYSWPSEEDRNIVLEYGGGK
jgi:hypothetical protein